MRKKYYIPFFILIILLLLTYSCGPQIHSFKVDDETITSEDSLRVTWDVSGEPTLLIHEKTAPDDSTLKLLELILVVQKNAKEVKMFKQINVREKYGNVNIGFIPTLSVDTLIAAGINDTVKWGMLFEVIGVASGSSRPLTVTHAGKIADLDQEGNFSDAFNDTPLRGYWEIRSMLTNEERYNLENVPDMLSIVVKYQYKRR